MKNVDKRHATYLQQQPKRDVFAAVKNGTDAVREGKTLYLPMYPDELKGEYEVRLKMATIDGIVQSGVDTLCGSVFHGDIDTSKVNPAILPLLEDIDNKGTHFNIFARNAFDASFDGFSVIIVDTPNSDVPINSLGDEQRLGIRPYWRLYFAKDVINWRYDINPVSHAVELALLVLEEKTEEPKDIFETEMVTRYRVYRLDDQKRPMWELYRKADSASVSDEFALEDWGVLSTSGIPAAIIGCITDEPRLLVESRLEIKAYQKESSFDTIEYLSIPTLFTKGYEDENRLSLGASTHIRLPIEGDVGYVQIDSAGHAELKSTIATIKAYISTRLNELTNVSASLPGGVGGADKTATQAVIEDRDKQARLILWAEQFKDALELALSFTAELLGMKPTDGGEIILQTKWEMARQIREQMQAGLAKTDDGDDDSNDDSNDQ